MSARQSMVFDVLPFLPAVCSPAEALGTAQFQPSSGTIQPGHERCVTMRARYVFCVLAVVALAIFGVTRPVSATAIPYDHFTAVSGVPDPGLWSVSSHGGTATEASSILTTTGVTMTSTSSWSSANTTFEFGLGNVAPSNGWSGQGNDFGLTGSGGSVGLWSDWGNGGWYFGIAGNPYVYMNNSPVAGQVFDISLIPGGAKLQSNDPLQAGVYTMTVTGTVTGPLAFQMVNWGGVAATFDYVGTSTIPEPCSFALLVCGLIGLLAYAWRKRK